MGNWKTADRGRRLDHVWVSPQLGDRVSRIDIAKHARGWERPSDHVPVTATVDIDGVSYRVPALSRRTLRNQPSGTITERMAKAKAEPKLFVNREIFNQFSAAREVEFEEKMARLKAASR